MLESELDLSALPPLRVALQDHGLVADKRFGQHFLLDLNVTAKIARLAELTPGDLVLEVGPGPGGLTRALLAAGARVIAVETDARFVNLLEHLAQAANDRLTVINADAMAIDEAALVAAQGGGPLSIVANLPYNIGTALLIRWLVGPFSPAAMTLMFQKEVAERIVAETGGEAYGRLSVLCQTLAECRIAMTLPARAFTPPPKVESAVVRITPRIPPRPRAAVAALERVTAAAFGQRRKMLRSSLRVLGGVALCEAAGVIPTARAEEIDIEGFARLTRAHLAGLNAR